MDFASAIKPDVYRTVAVVFLPGAIATIPWIAWFFWPGLLIGPVWKDAALPAATVLILFSLVVGIVLENIGSRIEVHFVDPYTKRTSRIQDLDHDRLWIAYLRTASQPELIAHRYLSSLVTRFKFELSMIPALFVSSTAIVAGILNGVGFEQQRMYALLVLCLCTMGYLLWEARASGAQLLGVRASIVFERNQTKDLSIGRDPLLPQAPEPTETPTQPATETPTPTPTPPAPTPVSTDAAKTAPEHTPSTTPLALLIAASLMQRRK